MRYSREVAVPFAHMRLDTTDELTLRVETKEAAERFLALLCEDLRRDFDRRSLDDPKFMRASKAHISGHALFAPSWQLRPVPTKTAV